MKVSVQNHNKPLPFFAGGIISGAGSVLGSTIGGIAAGIQGYQQRKHDKEMAYLNQQFNEKNMETQNRYMVEQWARENEYNDPSAVAARYRNAGISPQSALGGSASGAGIAGSLSSAPSGSGAMGHSSSLPRFGVPDLGSSFAEGVRAFSDAYRAEKLNEETSVDILNKELDAQIKEIQANYKELELVTALEDKRADIALKMEQKGTTKALRGVYEKRLESLDAEINRLKVLNKVSEQQITESQQNVEESKQRAGQIGVETSREQNKLAFENKFNGAPMELLNTLPGASAFISYAVTNQMDKHFSQLVSEIKENKGNYPDPVREFVKKYWNKFVPYLNKLDEKTTKNRVKSLPFVE